MVTIQVTGTSTRNKGAELMLLAIRQHFSRRHPEVQMAVDFSFGGWKDRAAYGLACKVEIERLGRSRLALTLMPASFRSSLGIVRGTEVDAVLDASGFAFGDQHPLERTTRYAAQVERWAATGKPVVLLPQALGPFEKPDHAVGFRRIAASASLVFARDSASLQAAQRLCDGSSKLRLAPDFTNLLKPRLTMMSAESRRACIVPNQRMREFAASDRDRDAYLSFLKAVVEEVIELGLEPVALQHGNDDAELIERLKTTVEGGLSVQVLHDPVEIKRYVGESHVLIGSRFHALVSALSQGVPALATSWSHKYEGLLADYGLPEAVLDVNAPRELLRERINTLLGKNREKTVERIRCRGLELESRTRDMWGDVDRVLGLRPTGGAFNSAQ